MASSQPSASAVKNEEQNYFLRASKATGHASLSLALHTVIDVGVFDVLAEAGGERKLSAKEIIAELPITNPNAPKMVDAFLGLCACYGLVDCSLSTAGERLYSLNTLSNYFIPDQAGVSVWPWLDLRAHKVFWASMSEAKNAIVEGGVPFERAHEMSLYEYTGKDQGLDRLLRAALSNDATLVITSLLETYDGFKDLNTLVDVGGGLGVTLSLITSRYPSLRGINFDLSNVVQQAPSYTSVEHVGGDFFERVPKGDAILLQLVLHNWSDDQCIKLLKNCYDSIPNSGKVIVVESISHILPDSSDSAKVSFINNVAMSLFFAQGQERTREEYKTLAAKAGFSDTMRFHELIDYNFCVMEFFK